MVFFFTYWAVEWRVLLMRLFSLLALFLGNGQNCSPLSLLLLEHLQLLTEYRYSYSCYPHNTNASTCYALSLSHRFTTTSLYVGPISTTISLVRQCQTISNVQRKTNIHYCWIPTSSKVMISTIGSELNRRPRRFSSYHHCDSERWKARLWWERISCEMRMFRTHAWVDWILQGRI